VTLRNGDRLVVELEVDGPDLDWRPGATVELSWPDGRRAAATLQQSTRAGTIRTGETIRLVIELAPGDPPPDRITIATPAGTVVVVL
jgi:hypothetical protein